MSARGKEGAGKESKEVFSEEEERRSVEEEDFEEAMREAASSTASKSKPGPPRHLIIPRIPESVDDFLRNFLRRAGLDRTLNSFEAEWYGSAQRLLTETLGMAAAGVLFIPDALTHRRLLQSELEAARGDTELLRREVLVAGDGLARMQRERDLHRLRYRQVAEEKNRLIEDFKRLKKHLRSYEPALRQLEDKYQAALRQKMLLSLQRDRGQNATDAGLNQERSQVKKERSIKRSEKSPAQCTITRHPEDTEFPVCSRPVVPNRAQVDSDEWKSPSSFTLSCSIRAHELPVSCIALHPRKRVLASASDDRRWRLWALPAEGQKVGRLGSEREMG